MKLLLVDSVDFPFGGAHSVNVSLLMKGLRENGQSAFLVIPYGSKKAPLNTSNRQFGHFDGIPYAFVRKSRDIKKGFRFLDIFIGVIISAALIYKRRKSKKLDGVILGGIVDILRDSPVILTCTILKIPIYFWLVEKASLSEDYRGIAGYLNYKSQQWSEWMLPKLAAGIIVISFNLKKHYLRYLPQEKILISPILVSEEMHKSINWKSFELVKEKLQSEFKDKRLLVYSGSFGEKDGLFFLIEAMAEVVKKYPETVFVMTGKGNSEEIMNKVNLHIRKYNLEDKIRMVGFVNAEELLCYNSLADTLFVCRSNSAFANHGFPWKLGEYCLTGRPIVATRVSDIELYFNDGENLFIVEPNNPSAIAEKVIYIFEHFEEALSVAKRGRERALDKFGYYEKAGEVVSFIQKNNGIGIPQPEKAVVRNLHSMHN